MSDLILALGFRRLPPARNSWFAFDSCNRRIGKLHGQPCHLNDEDEVEVEVVDSMKVYQFLQRSHPSHEKGAYGVRLGAIFTFPLSWISAVEVRFINWSKSLSMYCSLKSPSIRQSEALLE